MRKRSLLAVATSTEPEDAGGKDDEENDEGEFI